MHTKWCVLCGAYYPCHPGLSTLYQCKLLCCCFNSHLVMCVILSHHIVKLIRQREFPLGQNGWALRSKYQSNAKSYHLTTKRKWHNSTHIYARTRVYYAMLRNDLVHVHIIIRVLCSTLGRMNFFCFSVAHFSKHLEQFHSTSQPHTATKVWTSGIPYVCSEILVTGLPQIQSYSQTQKIEKRTSKLNCHGETTEDADFLARTRVF